MQSEPENTAELGGHSNVEARWLRGLSSVPVALFVAVLVLLWPSTHSLMAEWEDTAKTTYTHGYLIAAICLGLLVLRGREAGVAARPAIRTALVCLLGAGSILWLILVRSGLQSLHQVLLPGLFLLTLCSVLGWRSALWAAFAAGYFYLAVPVWDVVNGVLQSVTTLIVEQLLRITGVPAFVDGNMVHLAAGTFEIAGGCSGLHFFIVGIALATLYGEVYRDSLKMRCKLLLPAIGLSLLANWLRVYVIIVAGYLTDMQHYLVSVSHYGFGWAMFAVAMAVFFFMASRSNADQTSWPAPPIAGDRQARPAVLLLAGVVSVMALAVGPLWNAIAPLQAAVIASPDTLLPSASGGWTGPLQADEDWLPLYPGADVVRSGTYSSAEGRVTLFIAAYASQAQGRELIGYGNSIAGKAAILKSRDTPSSRELVVVGGSGQPWLLRYFFQIGPHRVHGELPAQLRYGAASLTSHPLSAVVGFGSPCVPDCGAAGSRIEKFMLEMPPQLAAPHPGDHS